MNASISYLLVAAACLALFSVKRIPEGQAYTVHRFGRYRRTLAAGVHWILPLIERIAHRVSLTGRALELRGRHSTGAGSSVRGTIWFQVLDPARADEAVDHLDDVVMDAVTRALDTVSGEALQSAGALNAAIKQGASQALRSRGVVVTRCQLEASTAAHAS